MASDSETLVLSPRWWTADSCRSFRGRHLWCSCPFGETLGSTCDRRCSPVAVAPLLLFSGGKNFDAIRCIGLSSLWILRCAEGGEGLSQFLLSRPLTGPKHALSPNCWPCEVRYVGIQAHSLRSSLFPKLRPPLTQRICLSGSYSLEDQRGRMEFTHSRPPLLARLS